MLYTLPDLEYFLLGAKYEICAPFIMPLLLLCPTLSKKKKIRITKHVLCKIVY